MRCALRANVQDAPAGTARDGAQELRAIRDVGGVTLAKDRGSSVVWGMPTEAVRLGAVDPILDPEAVAARLRALVMNERGGGPRRRRV